MFIFFQMLLRMKLVFSSSSYCYFYQLLDLFLILLKLGYSCLSLILLFILVSLNDFDVNFLVYFFH